MKKYLAEFIGTFWLVFGGCGSAMFAAGFLADVGDQSAVHIGIGLVGVSLAFGLTVLTMAYSIGHISGCHLNPAVSVGLAVGGRFSFGELAQYIAAQVLGGIAAGGILFLILSGQDGFTTVGSLASNGFAENSPGGYSMVSVLIAEVLLTAMFLFIIMGATDKLAPAGFAPIAIGLGLTLIHLISIPISNTSVNPARSTGVALFSAEGWALKQLWMFWVAPIIGGAIGGGLYAFIGSKKED